MRDLLFGRLAFLRPQTRKNGLQPAEEIYPGSLLRTLFTKAFYKSFFRRRSRLICSPVRRSGLGVRLCRTRGGIIS
ncbi:MAG TPA: hypothetical protein DCY17_06705 [Clostridiales bacterium]|nr:hypothetical protein [Clostridiales bacterium]